MQKAIVESVDGTQVRIRIPELHKIKGAVGATPSTEIPLAPICTLPGCNPNLRPGDVVLVDFENEEFGTPVIIGTLFTDRTDNGIADLTLGSLKVKVNVELPPDTKIGGITATNLSNLLNLSENLQLTLDNLKSTIRKDELQLTNVQLAIRSITNRLQEVASGFDSFYDDIEQLKSDSKTIKQDIQKNKDNISTLTDKVDNMLEPLILKSVSYGTSSPNSVTNPKEGQLYLYIQS